MSAVTWLSEEPVADGWRVTDSSLKPPRCHRPPTPKQPRLHRKLKFFNSNLEHGADVKQTRQDNLETKEAEPKGEKVGDVGVEWVVEVHGSLWEGLVPETQGALPKAGQERRLASDHATAGLPVGKVSCGNGSWAIAVFCLWRGAHGNGRNVGGLFSSHKSSTSPGGRGGSCCNT